MPQIISIVSLGLSVASFCLFAVLALRVTRPVREVEHSGKSRDAGPMSGGAILDQTGSLAAALGKAGPVGTSAALSMVFLFVAMISSGLVAFDLNVDQADEGVTSGAEEAEGGGL
ncbi:hypothetical protein PARPLA_02062 [Rhodobacteraceae bacterium THAF1]|uniref:hypothetical protein n=1 Tax=Palleronia sp. THAF1 TaxID=2587842 RepID=UPI000F41816F|nr:hypothetical protein [Palleronia sp. THAF1]QFU07775.1 hypothetical protein FIU81_03710 [Palleronia sp. THAF1]VDC25590.1 hypothetical protein PARPLA_02062 [Rhodobacteraceae bacterium THAF1]